LREIKSLQDVAIILRELTSWKDRLTTKNWDLHGLRITNASPGVASTDYATVSQLPSLSQQTSSVDQYYTAVFTKGGVVVIGDIIPSFVVGPNREGAPIEVWLAAENAPSTGDLQINMTINGVNLLTSALTLPSGQKGPVFTSLFAQNSKLGKHMKVIPTIVNDGSASAVSIGLVVKRF
jgi:hypothetical protein